MVDDPRGLDGDDSDGDRLIDDVAVWNQILTFEEIEATYRAGVSIGQACRLR